MLANDTRCHNHWTTWFGSSRKDRSGSKFCGHRICAEARLVKMRPSLR
jgi:hypothetical protein